MAVRASIATGNFTTAGTWGLVNSTSYLNAENATESLLTTAYSGTRSSAFTPGAIVVSHIGVKLCERIGTTGTISVCLELDSDNSLVTGTEVTINVADLPSALEADLNGGWIFFKLASPVTLSAATAYQVAAKTSSSTMVDLWCDGTVDNLARALVTTTTGAPAAGDDIIIAGEKTGAGTGNAFTVTMDETASTDYGAASTSLVTPAVAICHGGTLQYGTTAATNYVLRVSGNAIVYSGGTLNIGTTGTPIPRDGTAVLEFDCAADGDFGLTVRNLGTFKSQGLSRTSGKNIVACYLNTDEAANSTSLGVDTDTGWLDNDAIAVASTTQTATQSEAGTLNGNAGASSLTVDGFGGAGGGLANAHSGSSPTQAEVVLLTRNVMVRSVSSTAMAYVNVKATSTVDIDWTDFRYLGEGATAKRGIEIETTTGSFNMQYSTVRDCEDGGVHILGGSADNITFSNNVTYQLNTANVSATPGSGFMIASTTGTSIVISGNFFIKHSSASTVNSANAAVRLSDVGITFTNNTVAGFSGGNNGALTISATGFGTFSGNTTHSNSFAGMLVTTSISESSLQTLTSWRNAAEGLRFYIPGSTNEYQMSGLVLDGFVMFGNATANITFGSPGASGTYLGGCTISGFISNGDSTFATTTGINNGSTATTVAILNLKGCNFSTASGIKVAHTTDVTVSNNALVQIIASGCFFGAATEFSAITSNNFVDSFIKSNNHDQSSTLHKSWYKYGVIQSDTTIYNTASPSERITPNSASVKIVSGSKKVAVASGNTVTISVYVRESVVGDGTDYNGNRMRLVLKRNDAMGITADTVIDTATVTSQGGWEQLTGTTASVTADGVLEFVVDCDGTTGWVNIDDWSAS